MRKFTTSKVWSSVKSCNIILEIQNLSFFISNSNTSLCAGAKVQFFSTVSFI